MQRKIAFRAWDKTRKQMNYKVLVGNTDPKAVNYTCNQLLVDGEWMNADESCIELMQFTGMTDFDGRDIYEGDILEWVSCNPFSLGDRRKAQVNYTQAQFYCTGSVGVYLADLLVNEACYVKGNIYTHGTVPHRFNNNY